MRINVLFLIFTLIIYSCQTSYFPDHLQSEFLQNNGDKSVGASLGFVHQNIFYSHAVSNKTRLSVGASHNYYTFFPNEESLRIRQQGLQLKTMVGRYNQLGSKTYIEYFAGAGLNILNERKNAFRAIGKISIGFGKDKPGSILSLRYNQILNDQSSGGVLDFAFTQKMNKHNKWNPFIQMGFSGGSTEITETGFMIFMNFGVNRNIFSKHSE